MWEAVGYEIPTISISRFPYPEYHSSMDTEDIINPSMLGDAVDAVMGTIDILENDYVAVRHFKGLVALSNPRFGLYIDQADPSIRPVIDEDQRKWNYLMDCLPRYFDGKTTVLDIAETHQLPAASVYEYMRRFESKGLISLVRPA